MFSSTQQVDRSRKRVTIFFARPPVNRAKNGHRTTKLRCSPKRECACSPAGKIDLANPKSEVPLWSEGLIPFLSNVPLPVPERSLVAVLGKINPNKRKE